LTHKFKLVVGGAGFIGSHLVEELIEEGFNVKVLDRSEPPEFLLEEANYFRAETSNTKVLEKALENVDTVFIQSGRTGIGSSIKNPQKFYEDNFQSLVPLIDKIKKEKSVEKVISASSIRVYGPGKYYCTKCGVVYPEKRSEEKLSNRNWEQSCHKCGRPINPYLVGEKDPLNPLTPYSRSKLAFENYLLDNLQEVEKTVLRYPFIYGPRQRGAADFFFKSIMKGTHPFIYEDGAQKKDFMYVKDVVKANVQAMSNTSEIINIGTGKGRSLNEFLRKIVSKSERKIELEASGEFQTFDVRNLVPDNSLFDRELDIDLTSLEKGVEKTLDHYRLQQAYD